MTHTHEHAPASLTEIPPHITSLESLEEQNELQVRLSLLAYQLKHIGVAQAIRPCTPETNDMEIREAAFLYWVEHYAELFRAWADSIDLKERRVNMDSQDALDAVFMEIRREMPEKEPVTPPTLH